MLRGPMDGARVSEKTDAKTGAKTDTKSSAGAQPQP